MSTSENSVVTREGHVITRIREAVGDLRVSTKLLMNGTYVTSIKHSSQPQHEGYHDVAVSRDQISAETTHYNTLRVLRVADELLKKGR